MQHESTCCLFILCTVDVKPSHATLGNWDSKSFFHLRGHSSGSRAHWSWKVNHPDNGKDAYTHRHQQKTGLMYQMRWICRTAALGWWLLGASETWGHLACGTLLSYTLHVNTLYDSHVGILSRNQQLNVYLEVVCSIFQPIRKKCFHEKSSLMKCISLQSSFLTAPFRSRHSGSSPPLLILPLASSLSHKSSACPPSLHQWLFSVVFLFSPGAWQLYVKNLLSNIALVPLLHMLKPSTWSSAHITLLSIK